MSWLSRTFPNVLLFSGGWMMSYNMSMAYITIIREQRELSWKKKRESEGRIDDFLQNRFLFSRNVDMVTSYHFRKRRTAHTVFVKWWTVNVDQVCLDPTQPFFQLIVKTIKECPSCRTKYVRVGSESPTPVPLCSRPCPCSVLQLGRDTSTTLCAI